MPYVKFLSISFILFLISNAGSDMISRIRILGEDPIFAFKDHFYWEAFQIGGTILLLAPFIIVGLVAAWLERRAATWKTWALFGIVNLFFLDRYFEAYDTAARASLAKHWTAAALSIGFLPFLAIPVAMIAGIVAFGIVSLSRPLKYGADQGL